MSHIGVICPNTTSHINAMIALADAIRGRGHRVTFLLLGDPPGSVADAGFEVVPLGGAIFPREEYRTWVERLGTLHGLAAIKHTVALGARAADAFLEIGPSAVAKAGVTAMLVDQTSLAGGTVADELGLPFATACNALLLHPDPIVPPYSTSWRPREVAWAQVRNRIGWAGLNRLFTPILRRIRARRRRLGLAGPNRIAETWSNLLHISQQPEVFEFPRRTLPNHVRFVGPLRPPGGYPPVSFPWERLDGRPLIYASFGTLQNRVGGVFRTIAEACQGLDAQLVMSTGRGISPDELGALPGSPIVVSYAPQVKLLGRAAVAVTHAGLNTVLEALGAGVPMVAVPVTNEQPGIAARMAWTGSGEVLPLKRATASRLRTLVTRVHETPSYRIAARRIRASIESSGGARLAAEIIEQSLLQGA